MKLWLFKMCVVVQLKDSGSNPSLQPFQFLSQYKGDTALFINLIQLILIYIFAADADQSFSFAITVFRKSSRRQSFMP
jgi:hypothetical protein